MSFGAPKSPDPEPPPTIKEPTVDVAFIARQRADEEMRRSGLSSTRIDPISSNNPGNGLSLPPII